MPSTYPTAQNGNSTTVPSATSAVQLMFANELRQGGTIANNSTAILYVLLGNKQTVSSSIFTLAMAGSSSGALAYYELPFGYVGDVWGIWATANGSAAVVEYT